MAYNYPYGNGQQLNLDWFLNEWKNLLAAWEAEKNGIEGALQAEIDRAEAALADVLAARDAAAQSAANALESKNAAAQSASDASGYLATVRADANTASNAAQNAAQSESNAAESAQTALASKNSAANSERNAAQSEANANSSKNAAAQSAEDANASKSAAAQSAADADASKSAAAQSAEDASDAAASVEGSAQQITTNANDIADLKEIVSDNAVNLNNITSLNLAKYRDTILDTVQHGRHVVMDKNKTSFKYSSTNTTVRTYTLFALLLQYNSSPANFITNLPDTAYIPIINRTNGILSFHAKIKRNDGEPFNLPSITVVFRTTEGRTGGTLLAEGSEPVAEYEFCNSIQIPQNATGVVIALRSLNSNIEIESECSMLSSALDTSALGLALSN